MCVCTTNGGSNISQKSTVFVKIYEMAKWMWNVHILSGGDFIFGLPLSFLFFYLSHIYPERWFSYNLHFAYVPICMRAHQKATAFTLSHRTFVAKEYLKIYFNFAGALGEIYHFFRFWTKNIVGCVTTLRMKSVWINFEADVFIE